MGESVTEERGPEDRSTEELLNRLRESARDVAEGRTYSVDEIRNEIEGN